MLDQIADQSKDEKIQKLDEFRTHLGQELKSAEEFKRDNPDREDMNALIELTLAIDEEAKAVADLVNIGEDCPEDWVDLEDARGSLTRTLARIRHKNWIALGPSSSRRINQLFFYQKKQPDSEEAANLFDELKEVSRRMLGEDLSPDLHAGLEKLSSLLDKSPGKGFFRKLAGRVAELEESMDLSLFDGPLDGEGKCAVCSSELETGVERCPSCGATVLSLEQARVVDKQEDAGRSQLLDSLNHSWKLFQREEINQENFLRILKTLSERISAAVESLDSPTAVLLDFNTRLELFTQLQDRNSLETHWPSVLASGRALVSERINKLERD
jgi:DNA-directed RNA polymerase subunit RPC12/RpoP